MKSILLVVSFIITYTTGANAMSFFNNDAEMKWEWPAERAIKHRVEVEALGIKTVNKIIDSPSFASNIPDPMSFRGRVLKGGHLKEGATFEVNIPKIELEGITEGSKVFIGMLDNERVICIKAIPTELSESEKGSWLENVDCK